MTPQDIAIEPQTAVRPERLRPYSLGIGLWLVAFAPVLWIHFRQLATQDHLSHFPITIGLIAFLAYGRRAELPSVKFRLSVYALVLAGLATACVLLCGWVGSGWIGMFGAVLAAWAMIELAGGPAARIPLRPAIVLSWMLLPLPFGMDRSLIIAMQKMASRVASSWLDLQGIANLATGVVVRTPGHDYLVEEACSGVNSLFAALTIALFWVLHQQYGWIRSILFCAATVFWVLFANVIRVWAVVYFDSQRGIDLVSEPNHTIVGLLTFGSAMAMSASTVWLFSFVLPPPFVHEFVDGEMKSKAGGGEIPAKWSKGILASAGVVLLVTGWGLFRPTTNQVAAHTIADESLMPVIDNGAMPTQVGGWTLKRSDRIVRDASHAFSFVSQTWTYSNGSFDTVISLDGPYDSWHDLGYCYGGVGWQLRDSQNVSLSTQPNARAIPCVELNMYRGDSERSLVMFTSFDSAGSIVQPPAAHGSIYRNLINRLGMSYERPTIEGAAARPPIFQVQLLLESGVELTPEERSSADFLYDQIRRHLIKSVQAAQQS